MEVSRISPRYVLYALFKRSKTIVFVFLLSVVMAVLYVVYVPWRYESQAKIVVKVDDQDIAQGDSRLPFEAGRQQTSGEIMRRSVNTHLDILHSADVTHETLRRIGIANIYPNILKSPPRFFGTSEDAANDRLAQDVNVTVAPNSNVLQVSMSHGDPVVARHALHTLIAAFMDKDAEVMRNPRAAFLSTQVANASQQVSSIQTALLAYKKANGITALDAERGFLLKERDQLEQNLAAENTTSLQVTLATAQATLSANEQRYLQAEQSYAPGSPLLQRARDLMNLARQHYNTLLNLLANVSRAKPTSGDSALLTLWTNRYAAVSKRLDQLNDAEGKMLEWQRQLEAATLAYTALLQRATNARFNEALNQEGTPSIVMSQEPTLPYKPSSPRIFMILGLGIVAGLFGGLGLCFFLEATDETMGLPEQVEPMLGLPLLATLDYSRSIKSIARESRAVIT